MVKHLYKYSADDINIRIAVPDGFHKDENYIRSVKPGGTGIGADDHKHLFNYKSLSTLFEKQGFVSYLKNIGMKKVSSVQHTLMIISV